MSYELVKYALRNFILDHSPEFLDANKVFFATERFTMPEKPYIMITELANNEDLKAGRNQPGSENLEVTLYKECIFTIAIYGLSDNDLSEEHDEYRRIINEIRNCFYIAMHNFSLKNKFTIKSMTDLRPLSETNDTGFLYRYEFDITCGYNEIITTKLEQSQGVIIDLEPNNIHIEVNKENMHV